MPASSDSARAGSRPLGIYLDALWSVQPRLATLATQDDRPRTVLSRAGTRPVLHLPPDDALLTRARAAHAAAHLAYGGEPQPRAKLKPIQRALLETLEDARVEWRAMQDLPGLRTLWAPFHVAGPDDGNGFDALLVRLAHALFDPAHADGHAWIAKVRRLFFAADGTLALDTPQRLREAASLLGNDIGQMRLNFNAASWRVEPAYRDDNHHLWIADDSLPPSATPLEREDADSHGSGDDDKDVTADLPPPQATGSADQGEGAATALWSEAPLRMLKYPEWDRLIARLRPDWCTVIESRPLEVDATALRARLQAQIRRQPAARRRSAGRPGSGRERDGEVLHTEALIEAGIALRTRTRPPSRLFRAARPTDSGRDVLLLIDASASTAHLCADGRPLLEHLRDAALLAAHALEGDGHIVRVWAFASDTRHRVRVQHLKDEHDGALNLRVCARATGLRSHGSTRIGAALRHAAAHALGERPLIVLLTDGEPHDIDVHDPRYLLEDVKQAVREARRAGVTTQCVHVGPAAPAGLRSVFDAGRCIAADPLRIVDVLLSGLQRG
ncbi:nitric oxide reductase activation protein NorD [Methyloversatilis discipulorum]|uniref:nitric oxide reductase activation protein NorD n=1 Tax=Methyloversatilis discipulorum TaxID=1119528 RepID=UPI001A3C2144|nr:VWA domain-containing protein [Methyloversatilis discipulorum]MBL8467810.1 VWA domain-containing protein [Methyloversatilis discipulorum]